MSGFAVFGAAFATFVSATFAPAGVVTAVFAFGALRSAVFTPAGFMPALLTSVLPPLRFGLGPIFAMVPGLTAVASSLAVLASTFAPLPSGLTSTFAVFGSSFTTLVAIVLASTFAVLVSVLPVTLAIAFVVLPSSF